MKKVTLIAGLLAAIAWLLAPYPVSSTAITQAQDKWTIMVYMAGDGNLEHWLVSDIVKEFGKVGSGNGVNILLLSDRTPDYTSQQGNWTDTRLFYVTRGMTAASEPLEYWGERNMGDPHTLAEFVAFSQENYPAERYVLVLWGHSWAWRPEQTMWDESTYFDPANPDIWASDGAAAGSLDPHEIAGVLDSGELGIVDIVAYDACEPQVIEVETLWRGHAQYMVAAQDDVWWEGFRQDIILSALLQNPDMSTEALAILMAQNMTDRTSSVVALDARLDTLLGAVVEWSQALEAGLAEHRAEYDLAYENTLGVGGDPLNKDLYDTANEIKQAVSDPVIQLKSQAVMDAVSNVVLYEWHKKQKYRDAHGIGIFWPRYPEDLDLPAPSTYGYDWDYYYYDGSDRPGLEFSRLTRWDDFLDAYVVR